MKVKVIIFGQLTDITGTPNLTLTDISNTEELVAKLNTMHPALSSATYVLAVDGSMVSGNRNLADNSTIALLPPFSGG